MVEVLAATPADTPAAGRLASAVIPGAWSALGFARAATEPDGIASVVREGDAVIGYLEARVAADELHIVGLAVDPALRRRGIATRLLAEALREAAARGVVVAHLEVRSSNSAAQGFYARFGFEVVGRRLRYYANGEDAVLLTAQLAAAAAVR